MKNVTYGQGKKWSRETNLRTAQTLQVSNKDYKAAFTNMFEDLKEKVVILREQMGTSEEKWQLSKRGKWKFCK